jgi:predicted DNA-binding transcriptional regulator AlpA
MATPKKPTMETATAYARTVLEPVLVPIDGLLLREQVLSLVPVSEATLRRLITEGRFPAPSDTTTRRPLWRARDIRDWIEGRWAQAKEAA